MPAVIDLAVLAAVALAAWGGWRIGGLVVLGRAGGLVAGLLTGLVVGRLLGGDLSPVSHLALGIVCVFGGVILGVALGRRLGAVAARIARRTGLGPLDRVVGALARGGLAVLACVLLGSFAVALGPAGWSAAVRSSALLPTSPGAVPIAGPVLVRAADALRAAAPVDIAALVPSSSTAAPNSDVVGSIDAAAGDSVVQVSASSCGDSVVGTGFVAGSAGLVVTNAHVVRGADAVSVGSAGATVLLIDTRADLAVLRVPGLTAAPLPLATSDAPNGAQAVVVGYPEGGPRSAVGAVVVQRMPVPNPGLTGGIALHQAYRLRAVIRHGNSGSPLFDTAGHVIGVVNALTGSDDTQGYAITLDELRPDLAAAADLFRPVSTGACA